DGRPDVLAIHATDLVWFEGPELEETRDPNGPNASGQRLPGGTRHRSGRPARRGPRCQLAAHEYVERRDAALGEAGAPGAAWELHGIAEEPTLHRIRWADVDGDGTLELVVAPLHGRGTKAPDWEGQGTRVMIFRPPSDPRKEPWPMEVADDTLHIAHNLLPVNFDK